MNPWRACRQRSSAKRALAAMLLGGIATARPATAIPAPRAEGAVVTIFASSLLSNGRGSGFCVGDGRWVVTCFHVVNQHVGDDRELAVEQLLVLSPWSGEPLKAKVVATDAKADLALLKLESGRLPALPVAGAEAFDPAKTPTEGARFTITGYGQTSTQIETQPEVRAGIASEELLAAAEKADRQVLLFVPSQGAGPGWSGGPVTDARGQVVGVFRALVAQPQAQDVWYPLATGTEPLRSLLKTQSVPLAPAGEPLPARPADAGERFQREFRAMVWGMARRWERAETERRAELALRPNDPIAHLGLSLALMGQGRLEDALKEATAAATLDPTRSGAQFQESLLLQRLGRPREAEEAMRHAVEREPEAAERRITFGALLASLGKAVEATAMLRRAAELAPNHPIAQWRLGLALQAEGKRDEALAALRLAARLAGPLAPLRIIRVDLAQALQQAGKPDDAEREFRELARAGDDPSLQYELAAFLASRQKSPEALQALRKCLSLLERGPDPGLLKRAEELKTRLEGKSS